MKQIEKVDGTFEPYQPEKVRRSIENAGGSADVAEKILKGLVDDKIQPNTKSIHQYIVKSLVHEYPHIAARYNLKKAIFNLGPTGYPFEKYIASIFTALGYSAKLNQVLDGGCLEHEIDIVLEKDHQITYVECKFHQRQSVKNNIKVPLYVRSRVEDLIEGQRGQHPDIKQFIGCIATNTRFTLDAKDYSRCKDLDLLGWKSPRSKPLPRIIDENALHPVTAVTLIKSEMAKKLIDNDIVLVRDIPNAKGMLYDLGFDITEVEKISAEADAIIEMSGIDI